MNAKLDKDLKPCPFCGGGELHIFLEYMIVCEKCKTIFVQPCYRNPDKNQSMLEIWNRRAENA